MSNRNGVIALLKSFTGQSNVLTIPRLFIDLLDGDITAALLLSQIIYWSSKNEHKGGWFYKSAAQWKLELGITRSQISRINPLLKKYGVTTEVRMANGAPTTHYQMDFDLLENMVCRFYENQESCKSMDLQESCKSINRDYTETTSESPNKLGDSPVLMPKLHRPVFNPSAKPKNTSKFRENMAHLESVFAEARGCPLPDWEQEPKVCNRRWRVPLNRMFKKCREDLDRTERLVRTAVQNLLADKLTFDAPDQIEKTVRSLIADDGVVRRDPGRSGN